MTVRKLHDTPPAVIQNTEGAHVIHNVRTGEIWEAGTHEEAHALSAAHYEESNEAEPDVYPIGDVLAEQHAAAHARVPYLKEWYGKHPRPRLLEMTKEAEAQ